MPMVKIKTDETKSQGHSLVNELVILFAFNAFVWPPLLEYLDEGKI